MKSVYSRGQNLSEYALVLTLITAAAFGMQAYMKRGVQGVIKTTADTLSGETIEFGGGSKSYPRSGWDEFIENYFSSRSAYEHGWLFAEKRGSNIYFYHSDIDSDDRVLVAGQDENTRDFTTFDPNGYPADTTYYDDDGNIQTQTYTYTYDGEDSINGVLGSDDGKIYGKYAIVVLTSKPAPIVQKGVIEDGLVDFKYTDPLVIISTEGKSVVTVQRTPAPVRIDDDEWHFSAKKISSSGTLEDMNKNAYEDGGVVYYYYYPEGFGTEGVLFGAENKATGDFTLFDTVLGGEGYPLNTYDKDGNHLQTYIYTEDGAVGEDGVTYGKYAVVVLSPVLDGYTPDPIDEMKTTTGSGTKITKDGTEITGVMEETTAAGAWKFKYEIGDEGSFSASDKNDPDIGSGK